MVTLAAMLDALEAVYPLLAGAVRERGSPLLLRFFACQNDLSNLAPDALLPDAVVAGG